MYIGKQSTLKADRFKYIIYVRYNRHNFFKKFTLFFSDFSKEKNFTVLKNPVLNFTVLHNTNVGLNILTPHFALGMLFLFSDFIHTNLISLKKFINPINWYGKN